MNELTRSHVYISSFTFKKISHREGDMALGLRALALRYARIAIRGHFGKFERVSHNSAFSTSTTSHQAKDANVDLGTPLDVDTKKTLQKRQEGFLKKSQNQKIKKEDFEAMKKQLDYSLQNAAMSFAICVFLLYIYMIFKDENDRDIIANLKMLRNEEKICVDTIAKILKCKPDKDALMFQRRLKEIREEIEINEKKLEGLDLPKKY